MVFVAHLADQDESLFDRYGALADKYRDRYSFGWAPLSKPPSGIGCYNNVENFQHFISAELEDAEAMERFVKLCTKPMIPELSRRNELEYLQVPTYLSTYLPTWISRLSQSPDLICGHIDRWVLLTHENRLANHSSTTS